MVTPWKFNSKSPLKNGGWKLEDCFPIGMVYFQGRTVKLRGVCFVCLPALFFPRQLLLKWWGKGATWRNRYSKCWFLDPTTWIYLNGHPHLFSLSYKRQLKLGIKQQCCFPWFMPNKLFDRYCSVRLTLCFISSKRWMWTKTVTTYRYCSWVWSPQRSGISR